jgi:hypothetical protein
MVVVLSGACLFLGWKVFGQIYDKDVPPPQLRLRGMSPQDLQLMRQDLRKQKQTLIAQNLRMTESEAIKFWAIYQKYSEELREINDEKFAMLYSYAQNWPSMSDHDALIFTRRWLELDEKVVQLRSRYFPLVRDVLPGKKAATFYQLDERISMMINLEFASQLPLLKGATGYQKTFEASQ